MNYKFFRILLAGVLLAGIVMPLHAQEGGVSSIFSKGVGARQMGLGGAVVAYPKDPTTIFWNPAGMEFLAQKSFSIFYASFLEGTSYNFAGYVHPTLNIGTFGVGVARIATSGIEEQGLNYRPGGLGEFGYDQNEFYLSYAKNIRNWVTAGVNLKFERQVIGNYSDFGFGADFSLMYLPELDNIFLRDIRLGLTIQNIYSPRLNPGDQTDFLPQRVLFGFAKPFSIGEQKPIVFLMSLEKGELDSLKIRAGIEYSYQNLGMIRLGYNADGLAFGAGAVYQQFQLDYAYGKLADGNYSGHRISFSVNFGKTREELLEFANAQRQRELNQKMAEERERERKESIQRLLKEGNQLYADGNYFEAKVKFSQVLELDPGNLEADEMIDESDARMKEIRDQELQQNLAKITEEQERTRTETAVNNHIDKGQAYLTEGNFSSAIEEFKAALKLVPENESIKELIAKAEKEQNNRINELINRADQLAKSGNIADAMQLLKQAQLLSLNTDARYEAITKRISELENNLDFYDFYNQGLLEYRSGQWKRAREFFEKAMKLNPNNKEVAKFYKEADRRENAKEQPITSDIQKKFNQAYRYFAEGKYQGAINIYEELLEIQPYNKYIIDALDKAQEELARQQRLRK